MAVVSLFSQFCSCSRRRGEGGSPYDSLGVRSHPVEQEGWRVQRERGREDGGDGASECGGLRQWDRGA